MLPFILRMVKTRVTGIQFQIAAPFWFCHDDQMVHEADTALYTMDAGGSFPLNKLAKAFTCNREVLLYHAHCRLSWHCDNSQTCKSHTAKKQRRYLVYSGITLQLIYTIKIQRKLSKIKANAIVLVSSAYSYGAENRHCLWDPHSLVFKG
jgi:hypothetical protein